MKVTILETLFGVFGFDEENKLVGKVLFKKNAEEVALKLRLVKEGRPLKETLSLMGKLAGEGWNEFVCENKAYLSLPQKYRVEVKKRTEAGEFLRENMDKLAVMSGFFEKTGEIYGWIHAVNMELAKIGVKKALENRDLLLIQAVQTTDDLDKVLNMFMSRIREWYGLHFPELSSLVDSHETYARLVSRLGVKRNFTLERLRSEGVKKKVLKEVASSAEVSMGAELNDNDLRQIKWFSDMVFELHGFREKVTSYVTSMMEEVAPNVAELAGPLLGARLIALAGGLKKMAMMPASTIQVLGAEKALFRALKTGTQPPKHGIIFQHAVLHETERRKRGKVARALAGKLAIAARIDAFSGKNIGEELKADFKERVNEIRSEARSGKPRGRRV